MLAWLIFPFGNVSKIVSVRILFADDLFIHFVINLNNVDYTV
jgi:hypothetical protein